MNYLEKHENPHWLACPFQETFKKDQMPYILRCQNLIGDSLFKERSGLSKYPQQPITYPIASKQKASFQSFQDQTDAVQGNVPEEVETRKGSFFSTLWKTFQIFSDTLVEDVPL